MQKQITMVINPKAKMINIQLYKDNINNSISLLFKWCSNPKNRSMRPQIHEAVNNNSNQSDWYMLELGWFEEIIGLAFRDTIYGIFKMLGYTILRR